MTDETLLLFGIGVFFVFAFGCYIAARENFMAAPASDSGENLNQGNLVAVKNLQVSPGTHV